LGAMGVAALQDGVFWYSARGELHWTGGTR